MKNKFNYSGTKNPTIQSILDHLAEERVNPEKVDLWPAIRVRLAASKTLSNRKELSMNRRVVLPAIAAVILLVFVAVFLAKNVTPVSAQAVLDKAYAAQKSSRPAPGIQHIRSEMYSNLEALPGDQGTDMISESYLDPQNGYARLVTFDKKSGKVIGAFAYDGTYAYSQEGGKDGISSEPLTIHRSPQGETSVPVQRLSLSELNSKNMFDQLRNDPDVRLVGQETWEDGRKVYALQSQQPVKLLIEDGTQQPVGLVTVYFDVDTYKILGNRVTMEKGGKELLISSQKVLTVETLPVGTSVAWDLSDLQGITIVDDPDLEHALPQVITRQELVSRTKNAFLLKTVPDGFSLEIRALPKQPANEPFFYSASYTRGDDDFLVRTWGKEIGDASWADETYTTASGLVLHFIVEPGVTRSGGQFTSALVETPAGTSLAINSTLPRDTIKAWAEELVPVK